jgi:hypothetical protein
MQDTNVENVSGTLPVGGNGIGVGFELLCSPSKHPNLQTQGMIFLQRGISSGCEHADQASQRGDDPLE